MSIAPGEVDPRLLEEFRGAVRMHASLCCGAANGWSLTGNSETLHRLAGSHQRARTLRRNECQAPERDLDAQEITQETEGIEQIDG